ncbi:unnamed protein product [Cyclocybe aegerita]|uniref:Uncharacterized protein n=1 Tax=Cyclocybe aegerita TaxID=1973307 RepID=A0A8S0WJT9_CYCAE|nr:unnamed protein product [Cyclocybe aegerita]
MDCPSQISPVDDISLKASLSSEVTGHRSMTEEPLNCRIGVLDESSSHIRARPPHDQSRRRCGRITQQLRKPLQRHHSISIPQLQVAESDRESSDFNLFWNGFLHISWRIFDNIILLQMGSAYLIRFHELALVAGGGNDLVSIDAWRKEQQAEWNRLAPTLGLLAAMHAAILAISPEPPKLAYSLWLGGGTLSVCGLFTVQYFPIRAFSMTDEDVGFIVENGNDFFNVTLLATAVASPVVICLWAAVLFVAGMVDYILESDLGGCKYRIFAALPVCFGIVTVVMTLVIGETIDRRMRQKVLYRCFLGSTCH